MLTERSQLFHTFQSTLPQGERQVNQFLNGGAYIISIHAPARGATVCEACYDAAYSRFQSTLPQGERRNTQNGRKRKNNFNPRSRKGSDDINKIIDMFDSISIHAPARGATDPLVNYDLTITISIHAPARGATGIRIGYIRRRVYFNPRSRKGSDTG